MWPTLAELGGLPREASPDEPPPTQVWPTLDELEATGGMAFPGGSAPTQRLAPVDTRRLEVLEAYDGLAFRTHFQVLGVPRDATEAQVREAYFRLAKRFHPDVHHDAALSDLRDRLEEVFTRLGEAYEVLCSPRIRASYERELARQEGTPAGSAVTADPARETEAAAEAIERGSESLAQERYWEAIRLFESAIPWAEGALKQQARILLARAYAKNPGWVKQGEELLLAVLEGGAGQPGRPAPAGQDLQRTGPPQPRAQHASTGARAESCPRRGAPPDRGPGPVGGDFRECRPTAPRERRPLSGPALLRRGAAAADRVSVRHEGQKAHSGFSG